MYGLSKMGGALPAVEFRLPKVCYGGDMVNVATAAGTVVEAIS